MGRTKRLRRVLLSCVAFIGGLYVAGAMMSTRSVADEGNATSQPTSRPALAADLQALVDRVSASYGKTPAVLSGELASDFDVAGMKDAKTLPFTGLFRASDTYRHEAQDDLLVVARDGAVSIYDPKSKQYLSATRPSDSGVASPVAAQALQLVMQQNPALFVALTGDGREVLAPGNGTATLGAEVVEAGRGLLVVDAVEGGIARRTFIDKETAQIRRVEYDFTKLLVEREGASDVKRAHVSIRYAAAGASVPIDDAAFAFVPPPGATEAKAAPPGEMLAGGDPSALEGKPAPAFALNDLDGKQVTLAEVKGQVVVLDFWATWCPPCRRGLPHLAQAAKKYADRGVKIYAVNEREDATTVKTFLDVQKLDLVALLDADGAAGAAYGVSGIPQTVIIGRDGKVIKVMVGFSDESPAAVDAIIDAALAKPAP